MYKLMATVHCLKGNVLDTEIPSQSKINPLPLPWFHSDCPLRPLILHHCCKLCRILTIQSLRPCVSNNGHILVITLLCTHSSGSAPIQTHCITTAWELCGNSPHIYFYPYHHYIAYMNTIKLAYSVCPCDKGNNIHTLHFCEVPIGELWVVHRCSITINDHYIKQSPEYIVMAS